MFSDVRFPSRVSIDLTFPSALLTTLLRRTEKFISVSTLPSSLNFTLCLSNDDDENTRLHSYESEVEEERTFQRVG